MVEKCKKLQLRIPRQHLDVIDKIACLSKSNRSEVIRQIVNYFWFRTYVMKDHEALPSVDEQKEKLGIVTQDNSSVVVSIRIEQYLYEHLKILFGNNINHAINQMITYFLIRQIVYQDFKK
jgi:metal-responsive CopG/Arc/MetJ family transcriptional regulator